MIIWKIFQYILRQLENHQNCPSFWTRGIPLFFLKVPNGYLYVICQMMYYLSVFWGFPRPILGEAPHGRVTAFFCKPALKIGTDEKTIVQLF